VVGARVNLAADLDEARDIIKATEFVLAGGEVLKYPSDGNGPSRSCFLRATADAHLCWRGQRVKVMDLRVGLGLGLQRQHGVDEATDQRSLRIHTHTATGDLAVCITAPTNEAASYWLRGLSALTAKCDCGCGNAHAHIAARSLKLLPGKR